MYSILSFSVCFFIRTPKYLVEQYFFNFLIFNLFYFCMSCIFWSTSTTTTTTSQPQRQRLRKRDIQNFTLKPEVREKIKHEIELMLKRRVKRDVLVLIPNRIHDYDLWKHHKRLLREQEKIKKWYEDIRMVCPSWWHKSPGLKSRGLHKLWHAHNFDNI